MSSNPPGAPWDRPGGEERPSGEPDHGRGDQPSGQQPPYGQQPSGPGYGPPYGQQPSGPGYGPPYGQQPPGPGYGPPYGQGPGPQYGPPYGAQPYGQSPPYGTPGSGAPAELGIRFVAKLLDWVIVGVLLGILSGAVLMPLAFGGDDDLVGYTNVLSLLGSVIWLLYFSLMESSRGQTLGKMITKIRVVGPDGGLPTTAQAFKRNLWTVIGVLGIIPFIGWIFGFVALAAIIAIAVTISSDTVLRQGWHDRFAGGTRVVRV